MKTNTYFIITFVVLILALAVSTFVRKSMIDDSKNLTKSQELETKFGYFNVTIVVVFSILAIVYFIYNLRNP